MSIAAQRYTLSAQYFAESLDRKVSLDLVYIPGGTFLMGSLEAESGHEENERPQHPVTVPAFFMGKYPITQAQWRVVAQLPAVNQELKPDPSSFKGDNTLPVECVSWHEVVEFCDRLSRHTQRSYRLPSEAEWEYACRAAPMQTIGTPGSGAVRSAGATTPFHFGETISPDVANYDGNYTYGDGEKGEYRERTTLVGSFQLANRFGLYDMHGNVWEWCLDHWHEHYDGAPSDGSAWIEPDREKNASRLLRGGSWYGDPVYCRSAYRLRVVADSQYNRLGFRVVCAFPREDSL